MNGWHSCIMLNPIVWIENMYQMIKFVFARGNICMRGNYACFFVCGFGFLAYCMGIFPAFLSSADIFQNQLFWKILSGISYECLTVWIQIRPSILSSLIWVKTFCKLMLRQSSSTPIKYVNYLIVISINIKENCRNKRKCVKRKTRKKGVVNSNLKIFTLLFNIQITKFIYSQISMKYWK